MLGKVIVEHLKKDREKREEELARLSKKGEEVLEKQSMAIENYKTELERKTFGIFERKRKQELQEIEQEAQDSVERAHTNIGKFESGAKKDVERELLEYKKEKMGQIEQEAKMILRYTTKDVLLKTLSPKDQEKLVMEAIKKATKEKLFS